MTPDTSNSPDLDYGPVPPGYLLLRDAFKKLGEAKFPGVWTDQDAAFFFTPKTNPKDSENIEARNRAVATADELICWLFENHRAAKVQSQNGALWPIPQELWSSRLSRIALVSKVHDGKPTDSLDRRYAGRLIVTTSCLRELPVRAASTRQGYKSEFMVLAERAVEHFEISNENQPVKKVLIDWFRSQKIDGNAISPTTAKWLASFVRLHRERKGGYKQE